MGGSTLTASLSPISSLSCSSSRTRRCFCPAKTCIFPRASDDNRLFPFTLKRISSRSRDFLRSVGCRSTSDSGENESRTILDAFFLGKALAETINERVESSLGEFLSTIGRLQAEQSKQVQEFQAEVLEKAKRAKDQAARESIEAKGLSSTSSAADISDVTGGVAGFSSSRSSSLNENPILRLMDED